MDADREAVRNTMTPDAPHSYRDRLNRIVHEHSSDPMSASQAEAVYTLAWDMAKKLDARVGPTEAEQPAAMGQGLEAASSPA
jgi:hypothetical protein